MREIINRFKYHAKYARESAEHHYNNVFKKTLSDLQVLGYDGLEGKRVLDMGCGPRYYFALQCAAHGAKVTAVDIAYIKPDVLPLAFFHTMLHSGIRRAFKASMIRILFDKTYFRRLEQVSGQPLLDFRDKITFLVADPEKPYTLPDESFDLIVSIAVLEHVSDVPRFAAEIRRLLKPGGHYYAIVHNFYSLSGGHNPEWEFPDEHPSELVVPWDHLRENLSPVSSYLNKLRPEDYREIFSRHLSVKVFEGRGLNHDLGGLEGEAYLTAEVKKELAEYPRELLLTRAWCMICGRDT
jgi:SAM-dependent methyltransferase